MRYLAFLFSIYFTLLAILPCQDREEIIANVTHVTIQQNHSANDEKGQETCPPFCTCSCCSTARHLTQADTPRYFTQTITREYSEYGILTVQEQPINVWQPPQIA